MTKRPHWKSWILACLCFAALLTVSACVRKEDKPSFDTLNIVTFAPITTQGAGGLPTSTDDGWANWGAQGTQAAGNMTISTPAPTVMVTPTPSPSPSPTPNANLLKYGAEGDKVRSMQQRLKDLGYLSGKADGMFGYGTEDALKAFQRANGLSADGVAGPKTLEKLNSSKAKKKNTSEVSGSARSTSVPKLKEYTPSQPDKYRFLEAGSSGKDVTKLQNRLRELGYLNQSANGSYDAATEAAVIAFQERNGQWVDGVAGEDTQTRLFSSKALPAKGGSID